ncbi:sensor histidine kinase [Phycicoccus sonneratiae]|uniref:histidine kinase n=1 Tax=Phycicoccus sonneratiae TaxID=2807628 RepID=A0ABS2CL95_9MICO|nr:ATP-binding protein [Phycicoccus sonneraticus]MBM6400651.1 GAF domain-containing protein [Phycicoccus sonneraticus]
MTGVQLAVAAALVLLAAVALVVVQRRRVAAERAVLEQERAALAQEQEDALRLHDLVVDVARAVHDTRDLAGALRRACGRLGRDIGVDRVVLLTLGDDRQLRKWEQWHRADLAALPLPPTQLVDLVEPVSHDLLHGERLVLPDLLAPGSRQDAVVGELRRFTGARGLLLVPVGITERGLGLLGCLTVGRTREWSGNEVRVVEQLSAVVAQAIVHQRLLEVQDLQMRELRALDEYKDAFLATVSHELRTPLTSIRGYLEVLQDGDLGEVTPTQANALDVIDRNAERLRGLIEDLLVLHRMETGGLSFEASRVDLGAVLSSCVEVLRPTAERAGVGLGAGWSTGLVVHGDAGQLERAVLNILGNAVKFTPAGGAVSLRARSAADEVVLEVTDTGIGIPPEDLGRLSERFFRAGNATAAAIPGSGLGLAIVRGTVERHGGHLAITSVPGEGTTVRVRLPVDAAAAVRGPAGNAGGLGTV